MLKNSSESVSLPKYVGHTFVFFFFVFLILNWQFFLFSEHQRTFETHNKKRLRKIWFVSLDRKKKRTWKNSRTLLLQKLKRANRRPGTLTDSNAPTFRFCKLDISREQHLTECNRSLQGFTQYSQSSKAISIWIWF